MALKLDEKTREFINSLPYNQLVQQKEIAPNTDPWFQGEIGAYWEERLKELQPKNTKISSNNTDTKSTMVIKSIKTSI